MRSVLKKDSYFLGALMGFLLPGVGYLLLFGIIEGVKSFQSQSFTMTHNHLYLLSIMINLLPLRTYMVNFKYDKTGRGLLAVTFVYMIIYFAIYL